MALNKDQQELLAVVKYYNDMLKNKSVARLAAKLEREFGLAVAAQLTGFTTSEIDKFVVQIPPRKVSEKKPKPEILEVTGMEFKEGDDNSRSSVITLTADASLHERIAYEMSMQIGAKFKKGDRFYSTREGMDAFGFDKNVIQGALAILREKNLIEYRDGSFRKGYIVK